MLEDDLRKETLKWLERIEKERMASKTPQGKEAIENINAYIKDSHHFLEKGDLIRAFECVLWAWAFFEIHRDMGSITDSKLR